MEGNKKLTHKWKRIRHMNRHGSGSIGTILRGVRVTLGLSMDVLFAIFKHCFFQPS